MNNLQKFGVYYRRHLAAKQALQDYFAMRIYNRSQLFEVLRDLNENDEVGNFIIKKWSISKLGDQAAVELAAAYLREARKYAAHAV